jgi:hypothetical protein
MQPRRNPNIATPTWADEVFGTGKASMCSICIAASTEAPSAFAPNEITLSTRLYGLRMKLAVSSKRPEP